MPSKPHGSIIRLQEWTQTRSSVITLTPNGSLWNGEEKKSSEKFIKRSSPCDNLKEDVPVTLLIRNGLKIISITLKNWQSYTKII